MQNFSNSADLAGDIAFEENAKVGDGPGRVEGLVNKSRLENGDPTRKDYGFTTVATETVKETKTFENGGRIEQLLKVDVRQLQFVTKDGAIKIVRWQNR